jgi:ribosomal peptide maturation radical SAM protein 1
MDVRKLKRIKEKILSVLRGGDILILVPPFGSSEDIALGPQLLQVLAEQNGCKTDVLYLNILLASITGSESYKHIYRAPEEWMLAERLFARSAYGLAPLGKNGRRRKAYPPGDDNRQRQFDPGMYLQTERVCRAFLEEAAAVIAPLEYKIVGCTTAMTRQTNCSISLLARIKKESPETITIIGGSGCRGELAEGIASLSDHIDYIFPGESERAFPNFLQRWREKKLPPQRIINCEPPEDLDSLPLPDYTIFSRQYAAFLGEKALARMKIWYETSRGCWWSQCSFCSECQVPFRQKSVNKVIGDIKTIKALYPGKMVFLTDIVMPRSYLRELLPKLHAPEDFPPLAYQVRVDLDLNDLITLKKARVNAVLPGIETFTANLLNLMNKGISARQSLLFLRNAACVGIYSDWSLLWGFPGDQIPDYKDLLRILPLIRHLQPPREIRPLVLMRFSPYLANPQKYKLTGIRPWNVFKMIYPEGANHEKLAVYYTGAYSSGAGDNPAILREIAAEVSLWKKKWKASSLFMDYLMDHYFIYDHRGLGQKNKTHILDEQRAREVMIPGVYRATANQNWALAEKLGILRDSWYIPLVTAPPGLLLKFEGKC